MAQQPDIEKDYGNNQHLDGNMDTDTALNRIRTAGSISISPELFEKIYLSPQNQVKGDLRKTFANPTPIALGGFLLTLTPLTMDLMGWRGSGGLAVAGGLGSAQVGAYYGLGALLMILGGIMEWILGNTFPCVVFTTFGGFWIFYGTVFVPYFAAISTYGPSDMVDGSGINSPVFAAAIANFFVWMGVLCVIYLVASLRTNVVFVIIFLTLIVAFPLIAAAFYQAANGAAALAGDLLTAAGALAFVTCCAGWYLFTVQILASVDFPLTLPVGDLSTVIKGASQK